MEDDFLGGGGIGFCGFVKGRGIGVVWLWNMDCN